MVWPGGADASRLVGASLETAVRESFTVIRPTASTETDRLVGRLRNGVTIPAASDAARQFDASRGQRRVATALINAVPRTEMRMALQARLAQAQAKGIQVGRYRGAQALS